MTPRRARMLALGFLLLAVPASDAAGQEAGGVIVKRGTIGEDLYVVGGRVDVLATVDGDVIAAGGRLGIGERVTGDVLAAGGDVTLHGVVQDDVRIAGGLLTLRAEIGGDLTAAGGSVTLLPEARVHGRAWLAGNEIDLRGRIGRSLRAAGNTIRIAGEVEGDVELIAREVEILPTARIRGNLTYRSPAKATVASGAELLGTVTHRPVETPAIRPAIWALVGIVGGIAFAALAVAGLALVLAAPAATTAAARTVGAHPWASLALGFALAVAVPAAGFVLMGTVVGFVLGLAVLALYPVWLLVGVLVGATFVGGLVTRLSRRGPSRGWAALSLLLGLVVFVLVGVVPIAGMALVGLVVLFGLGAVSLEGYRLVGAGRSS